MDRNLAVVSNSRIDIVRWFVSFSRCLVAAQCLTLMVCPDFFDLPMALLQYSQTHAQYMDNYQLETNLRVSAKCVKEGSSIVTEHNSFVRKVLSAP